MKKLSIYSFILNYRDVEGKGVGEQYLTLFQY